MRGRWRRGAIIVTIIVALAAVIWLERDAELREAAALWIVSDSVEPADVAVVLGGGVEDRPFAAAEYYRRGLAKKVLVSNEHQGPAEQLGVKSANVSVEVAVLLKLGVPASAIEVQLGDDLRNTNDEAQALRDWMSRNHAQSVIVPSEIFSARRVRWTMRRDLGPDVTICVPALDPPDFGKDDWWRHESGIIAFQNEIIKYVYYRLRY